MTVPARRPTRRAVLIGVAVVAAGCRSAGRAARASGPDDAALLTAWQSESQLLAAYADTATQHRVHLAHLRALEAQLRRPPSPQPSPRPSPQPSPVAPPAEQATVAALQTAALAAHDGENAALLASIAASHAVLAAESR